MNYPTPRPTIAEMVRYQPNLSVNKSQRVIRLSANEGAFGPSPKAKAVLTNIGEHMHWYPEEEPVALAEALGKKYNLEVINPIQSNGVFSGFPEELNGIHIYKLDE